MNHLVVKYIVIQNLRKRIVKQDAGTQSHWIMWFGSHIKIGRKCMQITFYMLLACLVKEDCCKMDHG